MKRMAEVCMPKTSQDDKKSPKETFTKYSMKRLELSIKKFIKVLSIDLDRLQKHSLNISRLTKFEDWTGLHKEQVNATRTVQQINANILEIEKARRQVTDEDLHEFDERINPVKTKAVEAIEELMAFIGQGPRPPSKVNDKSNADVVKTGTGDVDLHSLLLQSSESNVMTESMTRSLHTGKRSSVTKSTKATENDFNTNTESNARWKSFSSSSSPFDAQQADNVDTSDAPLLQANESHNEPAMLLTTSLHVAPMDSEASASWEQLQESIMDLNDLVHDFASRVEEQGENVDVIEDNIEQAQGNVEEGTSHLVKASKYKSVLFPVVGAVVGGVVGGPIGLLAGLKIGGVAGVLGGAFGLAGGSIYKRRQDKISDMEMSNMAAKRSQSMPEVLDQKCEEDSMSATLGDLKDQPKSLSLGQVNSDTSLSYFSTDEQL